MKSEETIKRYRRELEALAHASTDVVERRIARECGDLLTRCLERVVGWEAVSDSVWQAADAIRRDVRHEYNLSIPESPARL